MAIEEHRKIMPTNGPAARAIGEIQGLRALAVGAVVVGHLWPLRLEGGYLGVDVFFVISGFLIIGHIGREVETTGRFALLDFWARRIRRLVPASIVVLVSVGVATLLIAPRTVWGDWFQQIAASAAYVQNWILRDQAVDYWAADSIASPVQHFWSLSIEEQFYFGWPIVIGVALALVRRRLSGQVVITTALVVVALASFTYAAFRSGGGGALYFDTIGRAWEFAVGGIVAQVCSGRHSHARSPGRFESFMLVLSSAVLLITFIKFTSVSGVPGPAALVPVIAAAVLLAGFARYAGSASLVTRVFRSKPLVWVGDQSYSIYLWHWPLLIFAELIFGPVGLIAKLAVIGLTVFLAAVSRRYIEDPFRVRSKSRVPLRTGLTFGLSAAVLIAVGGIALVPPAIVAASAAQLRTEASQAFGSATSCVGANVWLHDNCTDENDRTDLTDPAFARSDLAALTTRAGCQQVRFETAVIECESGSTTGDVTIALVGDSHMTQYIDPLDRYGRANGITFVSFTKSYCSGIPGEGLFNADPGSPPEATDCQIWSKSVIERISNDPDIDGVVFSNFTERYVDNKPHPGVGRAITPDDFARTFQGVRAAGKDVVALRDIPNAGDENVPDCVAASTNNSDPCALSRNAAVWAPEINPVIDGAREAGVPVVDFTDEFCDPKVCHVVVGGLIVYFDSNHMTTTFAISATDTFGPRIREALGVR